MLAGLFGEPMLELRRKRYFTRGSTNVGEVMQISPQERQTADLYIEELRDLFVE